MADKRRDSRGRLLRTGEIQKSDGRYEYRYRDSNGKSRSVYSWRLVESDVVPKGKKACTPLRDTEATISNDVTDGIDVWRSKTTTLKDYFEKYIDSKVSIRESTKQTYKYTFKHFVTDSLKNKKIGDIKRGDVRLMYTHLMNESGISRGTMISINSLLHQLFESAVLDNVIRINPTKRVLVEIDSGRTKDKRVRSLTKLHQKKFMDYCRSTKKFSKYVPVFTVMMWTGCRIGEVSALRWDDCDFDNDIIHIRHTASVIRCDDNTIKMVISDPKTSNGRRDIPMLPVVKEALMLVMQEYDKDAGSKCYCCGLNNFVFMTQQKMPMHPETVRAAIRKIVNSYNRDEKRASDKNKVEPDYIPMFTPHSLRHTFCSRMIESDSNIKVVQKIMGHANVQTTLDIYTEVTMDKEVCEMRKIDVEGCF